MQLRQRWKTSEESLKSYFGYEVFGSPENEDILISFLNALLENTEKEKIKHVEYVDTKLNDIEMVDDKIGILDVRVTTEIGTQVNIEIQLINRYNMINRTLFYWSRLYQSQIKKGENYKRLKKTITINILDFSYTQSENYHTSYHLYEDEEKMILTDLLEIHFVELPKFIKEYKSRKSILDKWITFLIEPENEIMEVNDMGEPAIKKAITVLDTLSRDPETVRLAELRMKKILDERSMVEGAKEEGKIIGLEEGRIEGKRLGIEEGKIQGKKEVVENLINLGMSMDVVIEVTGLSAEEVEKISKQMHKQK